MNHKPGGYGLAWYSNTTTVRPVGLDKDLTINDLYIEGIDYLQIFGTGTKKRRSKRFSLSDLNRPTRMYKKSFLVVDEIKNLKVCIMMCEPASPVLPVGSVTLKFDNEILYLNIFKFRYLKDFFNSIGFMPKYISRIDVYRDFQKFKEIMPGELIKRFAQETFLCKSRAKFDMIGVNAATGLDFQYLRNGKKNSGRQFYLYNKSLEMKEVGTKEHIINTWKEVNFNDQVDTWRLELSMTRGKRNNLLNEETGELEGIELKSIFKKGFINRIYEGGLKSSFSFVINQGKRKTRCKSVVLFTRNKKNVRLVFGAKQCDKLRMRKIIIKSLICDILNDKETREHKSRTMDEQINTVLRYVDDQAMNQHLMKIVFNLAIEYKTMYYDDLTKFIYHYFAN